MRTTIPAVVLALGIAAVPVAAKTVAQHERHQQTRIERGVEHGRLTGKEAGRLEQREQAIDAERRAAAADGHVTKAERHDIRQDQRAASRAIHGANHNATHAKKR